MPRIVKKKKKRRRRRRDITLLTKVHLVKAVVFPVAIYGCESWTIKKAYVYTNTHTHMYVYTYMYTYMCTHIHTHTLLQDIRQLTSSENSPESGEAGDLGR